MPKAQRETVSTPLEAAARARALVEGDRHALDTVTMAALIRLVEFTIDATPAHEEPILLTKGTFQIYKHPNDRCCVTFEPHDQRTPYYEWRWLFSSWTLYARHCWKKDALLSASGKAFVTAARRASSRPSPPPALPSVEIMSLEEQIRQVLVVERDRGNFSGKSVDAWALLDEAGFDIIAPEVMAAFQAVMRGVPAQKAVAEPYAQAPA